MSISLLFNILIILTLHGYLTLYHSNISLICLYYFNSVSKKQFLWYKGHSWWMVIKTKKENLLALKNSVLPSFVSKHAIHLVKKFSAILLEHRHFLSKCKMKVYLPENIFHMTYCFKLRIFNSFKCIGHKLHGKPLACQLSSLFLWYHSA